MCVLREVLGFQHTDPRTDLNRSGGRPTAGISYIACLLALSLWGTFWKPCSKSQVGVRSSWLIHYCVVSDFVFLFFGIWRILDF